MVKPKNKNLHTYSVILDKRYVGMARKKLGLFGGKLSPLISKLLIAWVYFQNEIQELIERAIVKFEEDN